MHGHNFNSLQRIAFRAASAAQGIEVCGVKGQKRMAVKPRKRDTATGNLHLLYLDDRLAKRDAISGKLHITVDANLA